ncbi:MAG TPA: hypothetical protein V6D29_13230 [Leptolyngbyaceae cyanobacterium]
MSIMAVALIVSGNLKPGDSVDIFSEQGHSYKVGVDSNGSYDLTACNEISQVVLDMEGIQAKDLSEVENADYNQIAKDASAKGAQLAGLASESSSLYEEASLTKAATESFALAQWARRQVMRNFGQF